MPSQLIQLYFLQLSFIIQWSAWNWLTVSQTFASDCMNCVLPRHDLCSWLGVMPRIHQNTHFLLNIILCEMCRVCMLDEIQNMNSLCFQDMGYAADFISISMAPFIKDIKKRGRRLSRRLWRWCKVVLLAGQGMHTWSVGCGFEPHYGLVLLRLLVSSGWWAGWLAVWMRWPAVRYCGFRN